MSKPTQLSLAEVRRMPATEISRALKAGELSELLAGRDPGNADPPAPFVPPGNADHGARGRTYVSPAAWLRSLSPEEIHRLLREGALDPLLRRES